VAERMYLVVAALIAAALAADALLNDGVATLFLIRKLFQLVEYLAFWR
jgi:hypothetical protein